ncbi:hypothetical protein [Streptomyces oceani]|uniref:Secreted protein n=1 Tax=Streptomyces oceani TaxID=1075402 RepID=A0A1E7KNB9_9ACTN|nr:hypothetical protein [Streptomyces oceani]OEV05374.1 hypothetical protein AN216_03510 [Streptomyces oceani]
MSAISIAMLVSATVATALGGVALRTARGLRRRLDELTAEPPRAGTPTAYGDRAYGHPAYDPAHGGTGAPTVPATREAPSAEIRAAVAEALAEERERDLDEARAFWAAREARGTEAEFDLLLEGHGTEYEAVRPGTRQAENPPADIPAELDSSLLEALLEGRRSGLEGCYGHWESALFVPRQTGTEQDPRRAGGPRAGRPSDGAEQRHEGDGESPGDCPREDAGRGALSDDLNGDPGAGFGDEDREVPTEILPADGRGEPADLEAARRRHPSHPDFTLAGEPAGGGPAALDRPVLADQERTLERLARLAGDGTPLVDAQPGPLGTLDVYSFADGSTLCVSPGHLETARRLGEAIDAGPTPVLLGGSGAAGAYTLTFTIGDEHVYLLASRVIASL